MRDAALQPASLCSLRSLVCLIHEFTSNCCQTSWQARSPPCIDPDPMCMHSRERKPPVFSRGLSCGLGQRRGKRDRKQKAEHLRALPEVASASYQDGFISKHEVFYGCARAKILFEIRVHIIFTVQTRQRIKTTVCHLSGFLHLIKRRML